MQDATAGQDGAAEEAALAWLKEAVRELLESPPAGRAARPDADRVR